MLIESFFSKLIIEIDLKFKNTPFLICRDVNFIYFNESIKKKLFPLVATFLTSNFLEKPYLF